MGYSNLVRNLAFGIFPGDVSLDLTTRTLTWRQDGLLKTGLFSRVLIITKRVILHNIEYLDDENTSNYQI